MLFWIIASIVSNSKTPEAIFCWDRTNPLLYYYILLLTYIYIYIYALYILLLIIYDIILLLIHMIYTYTIIYIYIVLYIYMYTYMYMCYLWYYTSIIIVKSSSITILSIIILSMHSIHNNTYDTGTRRPSVLCSVSFFVLYNRYFLRCISLGFYRQWLYSVCHVL